MHGAVQQNVYFEEETKSAYELFIIIIIMFVDSTNHLTSRNFGFFLIYLFFLVFFKNSFSVKHSLILTFFFKIHV